MKIYKILFSVMCMDKATGSGSGMQKEFCFLSSGDSADAGFEFKKKFLAKKLSKGWVYRDFEIRRIELVGEVWGQ